MSTVMAVYAGALRRAADGRPAEIQLLDSGGWEVTRSDAANWCGDPRAGDNSLLDRCTGPTLDVGCGPGRLVAALADAGLPALGVDVSAEAVRQARRRGANAIRGCVFQPLPAEGRWSRVLLADGNIGIGGDPTRLLHRCRSVLAPGGHILVEVAPPGTPGWAGQARLRAGGRTSTAFAWAVVAADELAAIARPAALHLVEQWTQAARWFARLAR